MHTNKSVCTRETRARNVRSSPQIVAHSMIGDWANDKITGYALDSLFNLKSALKTAHPIASARMANVQFHKNEIDQFKSLN